MKLVVFYRRNAEYTRSTEEYLEDLQAHHDIDESKIQIMDVDSREGADLARAYDVVAYPGMVVVDDMGGFVKLWSGELPLQNELMSYMFQN